MSEITQDAPIAHDAMPEGHEAPPPGVRVMALVRWLLVALMAGAALWSVGSSVGWFGAGADEHAHQAKYYCPMHPQIVSDHPGECPICHMTLEPMPEHLGADTAPQTSDVPGLATITLTPERVQLTGMRTAQVQRQALGGDLHTIGTVAANEKGLAVVSPRFEGWIERLAVGETGKHVTKGQLLATVYSPEVLAAQQELLNARRWSAPGTGSAAAPIEIEQAARRRLELLGMTAADIDAMVASGTASRTVPLRAPRAGHVISKNAIQGAHVEPGAPLFEIADLSTVWVLTEVYEQDAARIRIGQEATISLSAYSGEIWKGLVTFVQPTVDAMTRTLQVRIELPNRDLRLKPGMYGDVTLAAPPTDTLTVPGEAIVDTGGVQYVFVAKPGGEFEPRRVRVGLRSGASAEVLEGLREGELIVTTGNFLLDSESRLRATAPSGTSK